MSTYKKNFFCIIPIKNGLFRIKFLRLVFREVQHRRTGCTFKFKTGTKIKEFFKNTYHTLVNHVGDFEKTNFLKNCKHINKKFIFDVKISNCIVYKIKCLQHIKKSLRGSLDYMSIKNTSRKSSFFFAMFIKN